MTVISKIPSRISVWWLFLIAGIPAVVYTGATLKGTIGDPFPFSSW